MDCIVHWVAKSWTRLSDFHFHFLTLRALCLWALFSSSLVADLHLAIWAEGLGSGWSGHKPSWSLLKLSSVELVMPSNHLDF